MMYRPNSTNASSGAKRRRRRRNARRGLGVAVVLVALVAVGGLLAFATLHRSGDETASEAPLSFIRSPFSALRSHKNEARVYRTRLQRDAIKPLNYRAIRYRELFNDSNYVQLSAARAVGIDPDALGDPADSKELVPIFSNEYYEVDTMWHALPYLVPEAALLAHYVGERFQLLMAQHYPQLGLHRPILTSALRTEQTERRLRRVNRNATDTSAHIYGTTFDLSAQRYLHVPSGHDTVVDACKQMLAMALYELRQEGLCYVKYERGSCFHITVRTTQYEGSLPSEQCSYLSPGSPAYLKTKAPARPRAPKPRVARAASKAPAQAPARPAIAATGRRQRQQRQATAPAATERRQASTPHATQALTDRERLSLEQYERNY